MGSKLWVISLVVVFVAGDGVVVGYRDEVERWRKQREESLRADDGWLTLVGLHWLRPGETRLGSDPSSDILLPSGVPAKVGVLTLETDGKAHFRAAPGVDVTVSGRPIAGGAVRSDAGGAPDVLAVGSVRLILLKRGDRHALRVKDNASAARASFAGLRWAPIDEGWRVRARFVAHASPTRLVMDTIVGERDAMESPGDVVFTRSGQEYRLRAVKEGDKLWFVFRDATSGRTTHGGARQLTADPPDKDGVVILDFNKASNLPCAYTAYATCPLPPPENRLTLPIPAGELKYEPYSRLMPGFGGTR